MTSEELNRIFFLRREIDSERRRLNDLKIIATSATVSLIDGMPHAKPTTSRPENFSILIVESERRICELASKLDSAAAEMTTAIYSAGLPMPMSSSLVLRYCACLTPEEISERLQLTRRYVQMLIRAGERALVGAERAG